MVIPFSKKDIYCSYCVEKVDLITVDHYNKKDSEALAGIYKCEKCMVILVFDNLENKMFDCTKEHIEIMKTVLYPKLKKNFVFKRKEKTKK